MGHCFGAVFGFSELVLGISSFDWATGPAVLKSPGGQFGFF